MHDMKKALKARKHKGLTIQIILGEPPQKGMLEPTPEDKLLGKGKELEKADKEEMEKGE